MIVSRFFPWRSNPTSTCSGIGSAVITRLYASIRSFIESIAAPSTWRMMSPKTSCGSAVSAGLPPRVPGANAALHVGQLQVAGELLGDLAGREAPHAKRRLVARLLEQFLGDQRGLAHVAPAAIAQRHRRAHGHVGDPPREQGHLLGESHRHALAVERHDGIARLQPRAGRPRCP
jgi:hypothetical protein